jgi:hypothetical protein
VISLKKKRLFWSSTFNISEDSVFYFTKCPNLTKIYIILRIHKYSAGNREQGTGNREQGTGNRVQGTGNREQGTGNRERLIPSP